MRRSRAGALSVGGICTTFVDMQPATDSATEAGDPAGLTTLSPRELEVLRLLADGMRSSEIAQQLGIAVPTVKCHLTRTYRKLGVRNRVGAVLHYLRAAPASGD